MNKKDEIICNTVFISFICYYFFILFLALRNIGKNIYIYSRLQNQPCFFLYIYIYIYIFSLLLSRALIWLGHFRPFWIISFEFVKVCWIRFSSWESFIGFSIWCYPISSILARLFIICEKLVVLEREHSRGDAISCLLPCVLYFMEAEFEKIITKIRRVSFIDLY